MSNSKAYKEYKIDNEEYLELLHFCRQYHTKKEKARSCYSLRAVSYDGVGGGTSISKPTEQRALLAAALNHDCDIIERAALMVTDPQTSTYLLRNVTSSDMPYERLGSVPIGRRQFYELRCKFFYTLSVLKKGNTNA